MGAKSWMVVYSDSDIASTLRSEPSLDRDASTLLARKLFPEFQLKALDDETLVSACPPDDEILVACYPGLSIVAASEFSIDYPSTLPGRFLDSSLGSSIHLHAMHSAVDWLAFALWKHGVLRRSLSLSPDSGILEDIGDRLDFEVPFWEGNHPAIDPDEDQESYPLPFHPLELGEAALAEFFGYQLEGVFDPTHLEPDRIALMRFKRRRRRRKGR